MKAIFLMVLIFITGCAGSRVSEMPVTKRASHPVDLIALSPSGGLLAEAVGIELSNLGYSIVDSSATTSLLVRLNLDEFELSTPQGLQQLHSKGIDAYLTVKASGAYDQQVQSASARATSTHTGEIIAGVTWQNGWGGQPGSIADRTMRKGVNEAAREIAEAISNALPRHKVD